MIDWSKVPVVMVPIERFTIPLHDIHPSLLHEEREEPVLAFSRWPGEGEVLVHDGRHRVLSRLVAGERLVATRLLVIP